MKSYNDQGFIIKMKPFPEADKLVIFLTRRHGIVETVAKGSARSNSRKVSSLDLLNHVKASFYVTKSLDILREIELINDFNTIKKNKDIINGLLYILEIIDRINASSEGEVNAYNLLEDFLYLSEENVDKFLLLLTGFEIKLLHLAGFSPNLTTYIKTEQPILPEEKRILAYDNDLGYMLSSHSSTSRIVSDKIIKVQRYLIKNSFKDILRLDLEQKLIKELQNIHRIWIESVIEKRLKSTSLLN